MIKKTLFTIDYYEKEDFINQSEIDKLCASIDRNSLTDYDYIPGNAKTSIGVSQNQFLDFHKDLEERIVKEIPIKNQRMAESWVTIQKEDSKLKWHKHPNSVVSGILYLKVDDDSSKLVFQNPTSMEGEVKEIKPKPGLLLMWPSFLMHGSGDTINKSKERIIIGFNSYWDKK
tara:strand:- start:240 stop:758 length:519 start_codon:yes stop_codon:yes gene_type:complete